MEFLKENYKHIKNLEDLFLNSRSLDLFIQNRRFSYATEKNKADYQEIFLFKGCKKIIKEEFLNLDTKNELLIENNVFLKSLKEFEFLFKNEITFEFKINDENETFDYVVSNSIMVEGFYFFTKDYNFQSNLKSRLNSIFLRKIGKDLDSVNKNDIEIMKVLNYK